MHSLTFRLLAAVIPMVFASSASGAGALPPCKGGICFVSDAAKLAYEKANACTFQSTACAGMDAQTQCCVTDPKTHQQTVLAKQVTAANGAVDWANYVKECPSMHQSTAPPDALWQSCKVGQKQSPADDYPIMVVKPNPSDPKARPYCIDGCSTPPNAVSALYYLGIFVVKDRNNPTGVPSASFLQACSNHDICYQTCNASVNEATCDDQLLQQSLAACDTLKSSPTFMDKNGKMQKLYKSCVNAAQKMHTGLQLGGSPAFQMRRAQYCQCC